MKELFLYIVFGLFGLYFILTPAILIMKIKYYKTVRGKKYNGIADLFTFFSSEWWLAGFTLGFPIGGRDKDLKLNAIRKKANLRLYFLYLTIIIQLVLVGILDKV